METRISQNSLKKSLLFLLCCSSGMQARRNLIENIKIEKNRMVITPNSYLVETYLNEDKFIVTYENEVNLEELDYETVTAPYVLSMASVVWVSGKKFYIPKMDEHLYNSLLVIREVYKIFYPEATWNG